MHHTPLDPPACPVCEQPGQRNRHLPEQLGPWTCDRCALFYRGTTAEFEHYEVARQQRTLIRERRKQLREERDGA